MAQLMGFRGRLFTTAAMVFCVASAGDVVARDLTDAENAQLTDAVTRFDTAMEGMDIATLVKAIPPRVVKQMAAHDAVSEDEIRKVMGDLIGQTFEALPVHSFTMKLSDAEHGELANGTPYLIIPTETVMSTGGEGKTLMRAETLALLDGDAWYLVGSSDARQVSILREAYPEYEAVAFQVATMEIVKE
jgi:hypothetical protein